MHERKTLFSNVRKSFVHIFLRKEGSFRDFMFPQGGEPVNKKELAAEVAAKCEMTNADAARALDATLDIITDTLKAGDEIRLLGFGTFLTAQR